MLDATARLAAQAPFCTHQSLHQAHHQILTPTMLSSAAISFVDDDLEFHGKPVMSTVVEAVYKYRLLMAQPSLCHQEKYVGGVRGKGMCHALERIGQSCVRPLPSTRLIQIDLPGPMRRRLGVPSSHPRTSPSFLTSTQLLLSVQGAFPERRAGHALHQLYRDHGARV